MRGEQGHTETEAIGAKTWKPAVALLHTESGYAIGYRTDSN